MLILDVLLLRMFILFMSIDQIQPFSLQLLNFLMRQLVFRAQLPNLLLQNRNLALKPLRLVVYLLLILLP